MYQIGEFSQITIRSLNKHFIKPVQKGIENSVNYYKSGAVIRRNNELYNSFIIFNYLIIG